MLEPEIYCSCGALMEKNLVEVLTVNKVTKTPITYVKVGSNVAGDLNKSAAEIVKDQGKYSYECSKCGGSWNSDQLQLLRDNITKR
jgi:hypothetical protein